MSCAVYFEASRAPVIAKDIAEHQSVLRIEGDETAIADTQRRCWSVGGEEDTVFDPIAFSVERTNTLAVVLLHIVDKHAIAAPGARCTPLVQ